MQKEDNRETSESLGQCCWKLMKMKKNGECSGSHHKDCKRLWQTSHGGREGKKEYATCHKSKLLKQEGIWAGGLAQQQLLLHRTELSSQCGGLHLIPGDPMTSLASAGTYTQVKHPNT